MRKWGAAFIAATALCLFTASPTLAAKGGNGGGKGGGKGHVSRGAPGPIAGAGLPVLLAVGGYALYRRRRNQAK